MAVPPLVVLAIGIAIVLGMIIWLRVNAFIALITAAIFVSLMAPGSVSGKISRVATAFGSYAGNIGIVIALAAVIGTCMMDSGAADRVVRTFLKLLGEKRASWSLMGSGFVLAVPVFFDTVFYLLVPLARSLYRKTNKNYLMYILAIAAGGAITHTLVPPTPGPLLMAANLSIDLGVMILVGAVVAIPAAITGVVYAKIADKKMNIPMRSISNEPEPEPLDDSELPSLMWSLLPVILPVLMISANTVLSTMADSEHAAQLSVEDVADWPALRSRIANDEAMTPAGRVREKLTARDEKFSKEAMALVKQAGELSAEDRQTLADALNELLRDKQFYEVEAFDGVLISKALAEKRAAAATDAEEKAALNKIATAHSLLAQDRVRMKKVDAERMNRLLLEIGFPKLIADHEWNTPMRKAADVSSLFGNANLALLLSAGIAMMVYLKQRKPTLSEMAHRVELSLMSGGAIILITAAGGAFGAMLGEAQIGDAIKNLFADKQGAGLFYIFLGFGIAALIKVAQGSSTTAMIVVSGMLADSIAQTELSFNAVYVATAIGAGSLVGSWMNDSGFWIFAKMGGLTEGEALKSWTPMLVVLGVVSLVMTVVMASVLPLV